MTIDDASVPTPGLVTEADIARMTGLEVSQIRLMLSGNVPIPPHLEGVIPAPATEINGYVWNAEDVAGIAEKMSAARERERADLAEKIRAEMAAESFDDPADGPEPPAEEATRVSESIFAFREDREREREQAALRFGGGDAEGAPARPAPALLDEAAMRRPGLLSGLFAAWKAAREARKNSDDEAVEASLDVETPDGVITSPSNSRRERSASRTSFTAQFAQVRAERARADAARAGVRAQEAVESAEERAQRNESKALSREASLVERAAKREHKKAQQAEAAQRKKDEAAEAKRAREEAKTSREKSREDAARQKAQAKAHRDEQKALNGADDTRKAFKDAKRAARERLAKRKAEERKLKASEAASAKAQKATGNEKKLARLAAAEAKRAEKVAAREAKAARAAAYKDAVERWKHDVLIAKEAGTRPPRKPRRPKNDTSKPKPIDVTNAVRALATMLENSPGELEAVRVMAREYEGTQIGEAFRRIEARIADQNASMVEAFAPEKVFPVDVHNMLAVGQKTVAAGPALRTAVKLMDAVTDSRRKLKSEIMEPISVGILSLAALFATAYGVMPSFVDMYDSLEMEIPPVSAFILAMSDVTVWVLGITFGAVALYVLWWFAFGRRWDKWRTWLDAYSLRMPMMGKANMDQQTYQLLKVLGAYINVGSPEREALVDAAEATKNRAIKKHLLTTAELMMAGKRTFAQTFEADLFPSMAKNIIGIGEEAGRIPETITELETVYEREAEVSNQQAIARISGTVAGISSVIFTVVVTMATVPPLEMFGSTLSYGQ